MGVWACARTVRSAGLCGASRTASPPACVASHQLRPRWPWSSPPVALRWSAKRWRRWPTATPRPRGRWRQRGHTGCNLARQPWRPGAARPPSVSGSLVSAWRSPCPSRAPGNRGCLLRVGRSQPSVRAPRPCYAGSCASAAPCYAPEDCVQAAALRQSCPSKAPLHFHAIPPHNVKKSPLLNVKSYTSHHRESACSTQLAAWPNETARRGTRVPAP